MSKTHNKYSKNFSNGFDDTHHVSKKLKEQQQKKIEKHVDNALKARNLFRLTAIEEQY